MTEDTERINAMESLLEQSADQIFQIQEGQVTTISLWGDIVAEGFSLREALDDLIDSQSKSNVTG